MGASSPAFPRHRRETMRHSVSERSADANRSRSTTPQTRAWDPGRPICFAAASGCQRTTRQLSCRRAGLFSRPSFTSIFPLPLSTDFADFADLFFFVQKYAPFLGTADPQNPHRT